MKPVILIFEGLDGSGKTTLMNAINVETNYEYFCVDRMFGSAWCYDATRRDREKHILKAQLELSNLNDVEFKVIFCTASFDTLNRRYASRGDKLVDGTDLMDQQLRFEEYLGCCAFPVLKLDTTKYSVSTCVRKVMKFLEADDGQ